MRVCVVLSALIAVTLAAPQYGYLQTDHSISSPLVPLNGFPVNSVVNSQSTIQVNRGEKYLPPVPASNSPIVHKQFYVVSAPEENESQHKNKHLILGRPQRNYRVVFIKAPSSGAESVKYSAEFAPQEEKTVIYVLSKKSNELDVSDIVTPAPTVASKPEVFFIKYKNNEEAQQAQKEIQDGWHAFREITRLQHWEYKRALVGIQANYGIFPYYKVSVENRYNKPHDYIITLDEGEIGLPDKYFYNRDQNDEIVRAYILLLRDFAINMGIVSGEADLFADEVFHYEKRIVNHINLVRLSSDERALNEIKTLAELKTIAPSLPILETLQALFPHTRITEETEILVKDIEFFHQISTVVATSDKKPINNFIIWSLARHLLPHLSKEYRNLVQNFDHAIYGRTSTYPRWMICAKIVKQWLPFAVDTLQQKKFTQQSSNHRRTPHLNKTTGNDEFLKLMYYSLRNQLKESVNEAIWIEKDVKHFIIEKLTTMRLQIGIPEEVLTNKSYIRDYYNELLLNNLFFVEHLQSIWTFRKARMEDKLKPLNIIDTIVSEMYTSGETFYATYSNVLNMLVISRGIATSKYFDYRFPIAVNFARIGTDILEVLINSISTFVEQFKADGTGTLETNLNLAKVNVECITSNQEDIDNLNELSGKALRSFHITLSSAKIAAKALSSFINDIDSSSPIIGASFDQEHTYDSLRLTERLRLPGLRSFNENELFTLAYMQKHCSTLINKEKDYARIKPHVEQQLAERYLFNATWSHIPFFPLSTSCSVPPVRCSNIL